MTDHAVTVSICLNHAPVSHYSFGDIRPMYRNYLFLFSYGIEKKTKQKKKKKHKLIEKQGPFNNSLLIWNQKLALKAPAKDWRSGGGGGGQACDPSKQGECLIINLTCLIVSFNKTT